MVPQVAQLGLVVALLVGCKDRADSPPRATGSAAASRSALPAACVEYKHMIDRAATCDVPAQLRAGMTKSYATITHNVGASAEQTAAIATACGQAAAASRPILEKRCAL
jgi:uncharacterized lipoprotein NlpE involved in copper resistance